MISKKLVTFYNPGKGIERVDDDGFIYPDNLYLDYIEFLDFLLDMHDGGIDDDL